MSISSHLIDFHAHILPGVDHGSVGIEETLKQLELMNRAGIDTVVATPHFYPHEHKIDEHLLRVERAKEALLNRPVQTPRICIGAEVLYCDGLEYMEHLDQLCIQGTNILMLELPMEPWGYQLFDTIYCLLHSYTVVLAHVDRYLPMHAQEIDHLLGNGALAQINTDSLSGLISSKRTMPFFLHDRAVAVGSDLHRVNAKTYRRFLSARKRYIVAFDNIMPRAAKLLENAKTI